MTRHRPGMPDYIVDTIDDFWHTYGFGPTVRELVARVGLSSTAAVHHHLVKLRRAGRVTWLDGRDRTLMVVKPPQPTALELTTMALHRWRHPSFRDYARCKCPADAQQALALVAS